jgi:hypothetical protein
MRFDDDKDALVSVVDEQGTVCASFPTYSILAKYVLRNVCSCRNAKGMRLYSTTLYDITIPDGCKHQDVEMLFQHLVYGLHFDEWYRDDHSSAWQVSTMAFSMHQL